MNRTAYISLVTVILVLGFFLGRLTAPKTDLLQVERAENDRLGQSMYEYSDSCAQLYQDGLQIIEQLSDSFWKKKFRLMQHYITETDFVYTKDIWMENCMWQKAIYNRYGLGIR